MRNAVLAGVFICALCMPPAHAADRALVGKIEAFLRDDEKALLAAILTHADVSARFDAEAPVALGDPKALKLFLGAWRGRLAAFAQSDHEFKSPDLDAAYDNYGQLMTPEQRAYTARRLQTMTPDKRNDLIDYLKSVNDALQSNGRHLTIYAKLVVSGILSHYRTDLDDYLSSPMAHAAISAAPAAERAFALLLPKPALPVAVAPASKAPVEVAAAAPTPPGRIAPDKPVPPPTQVASAPTTAVAPSGTARRQAQAIAEATTADAARRFDGSDAAAAADAVAADASARRAPPSLTAAPGQKPALAGEVPPPGAAGDDFVSDIEGLRTRPPRAPAAENLPLGLGAAAGALGGLLIAGPLGLLGGALIGGLLGRAAGESLLG